MLSDSSIKTLPNIIPTMKDGINKIMAMTKNIGWLRIKKALAIELIHIPTNIKTKRLSHILGKFVCSFIINQEYLKKGS